MQRIREAVSYGETRRAFVTDITLPVTRGFVAR
jgi:hypothetical protein